MEDGALIYRPPYWPFPFNLSNVCLRRRRQPLNKPTPMEGAGSLVSNPKRHHLSLQATSSEQWPIIKTLLAQKANTGCPNHSLPLMRRSTGAHDWLRENLEYDRLVCTFIGGNRPNVHVVPDQITASPRNTMLRRPSITAFGGASQEIRPSWPVLGALELACLLLFEGGTPALSYLTSAVQHYVTSCPGLQLYAEPMETLSSGPDEESIEVAWLWPCIKLSSFALPSGNLCYDL